MLDKNSLNKCVFVSQHWATLVQQVKVDQSMHSFIQNQITLLQVLGSERVVLGTSLIFKLLLNLWVSRVDSKNGFLSIFAATAVCSGLPMGPYLSFYCHCTLQGQI